MTINSLKLVLGSVRALVVNILKTSALILMAAVLWSILAVGCQLIITAKIHFEWPQFTLAGLRFSLFRFSLVLIEEIARAVAARAITPNISKVRVIGLSLVGGLMEASFTPEGQNFLTVGNLMPVLAHCLCAYVLCITWKRCGVAPAIFAATVLHFAYNTLAANL